MNIISKLSNWFKRFKGTSQQTNGHQMKMSHSILQMLDHTREDEYSCDDVYKLLDQYAEMVARGEDAEQLMPLIHHHLEMCKDCREEYEALLRILETLTT